MNQSSLLDPRLQSEESYEIGSVRLYFCTSVHLSRSFLGIWSLVFSNFWHGDRKPREVVRDKAGIFKKIFIAPKMGKKGPKWAKNEVFSIFQKTLSLVLAGNGLKWKIILLLVF